MACKTRTRGMSKTKLYRIWADMKARCTRTRYDHYDRYGGRGIRVCDEWINSFEAFMEWAKTNGYVEGLSIERVDVDGNYEPSNCKWIEKRLQQRNTCNTIRLEHDGVVKSLRDWCEEYGVNPSTATCRYERGARDFDTIMSKEYLPKFKSTKEHKRATRDVAKVTIDGEEKYLVDVINELGLGESPVYSWKRKYGQEYLEMKLTMIKRKIEDGTFRGLSSLQNLKPYVLTKDGEEFVFESEKAACDFLGVSYGSVGKAAKRGRTCRGYSAVYAERLNPTSVSEEANNIFEKIHI